MNSNDKIKWQEWVTHLMAVAVGIMQEKRDLTIDEYKALENDGDCDPLLSSLEEALNDSRTSERLIEAIYDLAADGRAISEYCANRN